jgi:hypothetical protein
VSALTFPVPQASLGDLLTIASCTPWQPLWQQEYSGLGTGEFITLDLAPQLWQCDVTLRPMLHSVARGVMARLSALGGSVEAMYFANPLAWWPAADPGGALFGPWTAKIKSIDADRKLVAFEDLQPGAVLSAGDFWAVDYGTPSRRALIQMIAGGTADGTGDTVALEVRPHIRPGIAAGADVSFARPAAKVKIAPGSLVSQMHNANRARISFSLRSTLQAA